MTRAHSPSSRCACRRCRRAPLRSPQRNPPSCSPTPQTVTSAVRVSLSTSKRATQRMLRSSGVSRGGAEAPPPPLDELKSEALVAFAKAGDDAIAAVRARNDQCIAGCVSALLRVAALLRRYARSVRFLLSAQR